MEKDYFTADKQATYSDINSGNHVADTLSGAPSHQHALPLDDISFQREHPGTPPSSESRKTKRARTEVTRSSMSYPRKRAVKACQLCRTRKTKCNNIRPICGACNHINAQCIYDDENSDHSSFDPASLMMLDRLNQILDILNNPVVPGEFPVWQQKSSGAVDLDDHGHIERLWNEESSSSPMVRGAAQELYTRANIDTSNAYEHSGAQNMVISAVEQSSMEYLKIPSCATSTNTVLQWPVFKETFPLNCLNSHFVLGPDESTDTAVIPSVRSSAGGYGVQEDEIEKLVDDFLAFVHIKNPILDPESLRVFAQTVAEEGPRWDSKSCLVYLACSLGCLAQPFELKDFSPADPSVVHERSSASHDNHKLRHAEAYYTLARKRIGLLAPSLITAHCYFFSGVYSMYIMQPLQGWHNFYQASTLTHMCLQSSKPSVDEKTIRSEQCLYWSCFKSECEMRGEIPLPVSALSTIEYPHLFPIPPVASSPSTEHTAAHADARSVSWSPAVSIPYSRRQDPSNLYNEDQSWFYYLTEIALRRIGNRVLNAFYKDGFSSWMSLPPQAIPKMILVAEAFDNEIRQRVDGLPDSLRYNHTDTGERPIAELSHVVRARVNEIQNWLCRPLFFYALHHPAHDINQDAVRPFVERALQYCFRVVESVAHRHRHHGTWYALRSGTTACLMVLATIKCDHIATPIEWEALISRHISTLKYWESESPDVGRARVIVERLLTDLKADSS